MAPSGHSVDFGVTSDSRETWGVSTNVFQSHAGRRVGTLLQLEPSEYAVASTTDVVDGNYTRGRDHAQWIENTDAGADGADDVYRHASWDVVSLTGRATYAFTRDLTIEAFLQPFVAVGNYNDIRKLARPSSYDFSPVTLEDDPDFNNKSLRGTVVMRWEYVRGSTLFLVWNRSTSDTTRPGDFSAFRDLGTAFSASGTNVLAVKINYWWTP